MGIVVTCITTQSGAWSGGAISHELTWWWQYHISLYCHVAVLQTTHSGDADIETNYGASQVWDKELPRRQHCVILLISIGIKQGPIPIPDTADSNHTQRIEEDFFTTCSYSLQVMEIGSLYILYMEGPSWSYIVLEGPSWSYIVLEGPSWSYIVIFIWKGLAGAILY